MSERRFYGSDETDDYEVLVEATEVEPLAEESGEPAVGDEPDIVGTLHLTAVVLDKRQEPL